MDTTNRIVILMQCIPFALLYDLHLGLKISGIVAVLSSKLFSYNLGNHNGQRFSSDESFPVRFSVVAVFGFSAVRCQPYLTFHFDHLLIIMGLLYLTRI